MALRSTRPRVFLSRVHFLIRFLGLTGVLVAVVGLLLAYQQLLLASWETARATAEDALHGVFPGDSTSRLAVFLTMGGAVAAAFALLVEILLLLRFAAGRRSLSGFNAAVQVGLAAALFLAVNVWAFMHPARQDWTRDGQFTLPEEVRTDLAKLKEKTTIIVYQHHQTLGQLSDKPNRYDYAAERKVVEKVKDLVEQMRALGPRFTVEVLDVEDEDHDAKLARLTAGAEDLRHAIEAAPENSIFFYAKVGGRGHVQRISFNDFYLLDMTASQEQGNLVLRRQGIEPIARKVLNVEEKKPRVALAVIHEVLTTQGQDDYGLLGLRKALEARGFEVTDVVLKKNWSRFAPPEPAAYTVDESKRDRLVRREAATLRAIEQLQRLRAPVEESYRIWNEATTSEKKRAELTRRFARQLDGESVTRELAEEQKQLFERELRPLDEALKRSNQSLAATRTELEGMNLPALEELQRMTDLRAKLDRQLADCDLLIVPRMTLRNLAVGDRVPSQLYRLDEGQVDAIREFLKARKPVLACFGPTNEPNDEERRLPDDDNKPDGLEALFAQLGIRFGKQTVLYDQEVESLAEVQAGQEFAGTMADVPPLQLAWERGTGWPKGMLVGEAPTSNPLRESLWLTSRGLGKDRSLDLRLRHPRPVYFEPPDDPLPVAAAGLVGLVGAPLGRDPLPVPALAAFLAGRTPPFAPDFLMTSALGWNEDRPFPTESYLPQFERPESSRKDGPQTKKVEKKAEDPIESRRRGPFPIGVAVEVQLPRDWLASTTAQRPTVRVAAIGQGGFFTGKELPPAQEKLFVNTANWLLGRDDNLPHAGTVWSYPRVSLEGRERELWQWGTRLGLPVLFAYLGLVVLLVRRVR
jgi:hypothetical protein